VISSGGLNGDRPSALSLRGLRAFFYFPRISETNRLTLLPFKAWSSSVAGISDTEFDSPESRRTTATPGGFFTSVARLPFWAGCAGRRKPCRFLDPVCQPAQFRPPHVISRKRRSKPLLGSPTMSNIISAPTTIPFKCPVITIPEDAYWNEKGRPSFDIETSEGKIEVRPYFRNSVKCCGFGPYSRWNDVAAVGAESSRQP
jgi:hypothetical protein